MRAFLFLLQALFHLYEGSTFYRHGTFQEVKRIPSYFAIHYNESYRIQLDKYLQAPGMFA